MRLISAAEANRQFSKILAEARDGGTVTVTSHGRPVAQIGPVDQATDRQKNGAKASLLDRLKTQKAVGASWSRDELYED